MSHQPTNVLITRPAHHLSAARAMLPPERFNLCPCPTISIKPAQKTAEIDFALRRIPTFDFTIFTSQVAVTRTVHYLNDIGINLERFDQTYVCGVGPVTADKLREFGIETRLVPDRYTAQALADLFPVMQGYSPRVLFPRGDNSSKVLIDALTRKGYDLVSPIIYLARPRAELDGQAMQLINDSKVDCVAFTSPSSVFGLRLLVGDDQFETLVQNSKVAAIGPVTAKTCEEVGSRDEINTEDYTLEALAKEIAHNFGGDRGVIA